MLKHRVGRFFYTLRAATAGACYFLAHLVFSTLVLPVAVVLAPRKRSRFVLRGFRAGLAFFVKHVFPSMGLYDIVEVSGLERVRDARPVVFVANHRGRMDGLFVLAYAGHAGVVMKSSYIRLPMFATFAKYLDFVSVDAGSVNRLADTLRRSREVLASGTSLLVFPEGTRAPTARMLPFMDTAFRLAAEAGVAVAPVVVHTDVPLFGRRHGRFAAERKFGLTIRFLAPTTVQAGERPAEFAERVERAIARQLAELDKGTVWERLRGGGVGRAVRE